MCSEMASQKDVRRIALSLPEVTEGEEHFAFSVLNKGRAKGFAWVWLERLEPKAPRVPQPKVLAVRVANQADKAMLLGSDPQKFFTEPHYNGFPAVLVWLSLVDAAELKELLTEAWRCQAPKALVRAFDEGQRSPAPKERQRVARSAPTKTKTKTKTTAR
jgi:hypothetical protein